MAHEVLITVTVQWNDQDELAAIAKRYHDILSKEGHYTGPENRKLLECNMFLADLTTRTGMAKGPKGGVVQWGIVGNWTVGDTFVEVLKPFWEEILKETVGNVVVMAQDEQTPYVNCWVIRLDDDDELLTITEHQLPISFGMGE